MSSFEVLQCPVLATDAAERDRRDKKDERGNRGQAVRAPMQKGRVNFGFVILDCRRAGVGIRLITSAATGRGREWEFRILDLIFQKGKEVKT